jgi:prepilin-type processing-associated H-X9-DG protein
MLGYNNYVFSHGDWITGQNEKFSRGVFVPSVWYSLDDIVDGISNTLAMSERGAAPQRDPQVYPPEIRNVNKVGLKEVLEQISIQGGVRLDMKEPISEDITKQNLKRCFDTAKDGMFIGDENIPKINREWSGGRWADGMHFFTITNTIMPPNGASCATRTNDQSPLLAPPTSYHVTGVNALMVDGRVRFISNNIDYGGNYTGKTCIKEGQSPFGVWGMLGSIADTKMNF